MSGENIFQQGQLPDPGLYGPETMFTPQPMNSYVPQGPGEVIGNILGQWGNVQRNARNAQANLLLKAFDVAQAQGPEAAQAFLSNPNLPEWFTKVFPVSAGTFEPGIQKEHQAIYAQIREHLDLLLRDTADMEPQAADATIRSELTRLEDLYPWAKHLLESLPVDAEGHFRNPFRSTSGKQEFDTAQQDAEAVRAHVRGLANTNPQALQNQYTQMRAVFIQRHPQYAHLLPEKAQDMLDVTAERDIQERGLNPQMTVAQYLAKQGLGEYATRMKSAGLDAILSSPIVSWWDPATHALKADLIQQHLNTAEATGARLGSPESRDLSTAINAERQYIQNLMAELEKLRAIATDPMKRSFLSPADQKRLADLPGLIAAENQRLAGMIAEAYRRSGTPQPRSGPGESGDPLLPEITKRAGEFKVALAQARGRRPQLIRVLVESPFWRALDHQHRVLFANQAGITMQELVAAGRPVAQSPSPDPQRGASPTPVLFLGPDFGQGSYSPTPWTQR